jgi:hypothetical protein
LLFGSIDSIDFVSTSIDLLSEVEINGLVLDASGVTMDVNLLRKEDTITAGSVDIIFGAVLEVCDDAGTFVSVSITGRIGTGTVVSIVLFGETNDNNGNIGEFICSFSISISILVSISEISDCNSVGWIGSINVAIGTTVATSTTFDDGVDE